MATAAQQKKKASTEATGERHEFVAIAKVKPSPTNTRTELGDLSELVESIKQFGILQPLLARPKGSNYELVFGHRRLAAAKKAGLDAVPLIIRQLDDQQVLEAQVVENCQRVDIHPLDEADAFERLHREFKITVPDIAAKVGKSAPYVYTRLKLCGLHALAKKEYLAGKIQGGVALLLARIPSTEQQEKATLELVRHWKKGDAPIGTRDASHVIRRNFMLRLEEACFDVKDAELVKKAGACVSCPKRTGNQNQKALFDDLIENDLCTDPSCYREKQDEHYTRRVTEAKAVGKAVASAAKSKEMFPLTRHVAEGFVDLDQECYEDPKSRTWREVLAKQLDGLKITVARDPMGNTHEVVNVEDARKAASSAGMKWAAEALGSSSGTGESERLARKRAEVSKAVARELSAQIVASAEKRGPTKLVLRLIAEGAIESVWFEANKEVLRARELLEGGDNREAVSAKLLAIAEKADANELCGLLVQLLLVRDVSSSGSVFNSTKAGPLLTLGAKLFGIDAKATTSRVVKERAAAERAKREQKK